MLVLETEKCSRSLAVQYAQPLGTVQFIVQKILLDDLGLQYICQTYERFSHVALILGKMVHGLAKIPSARLLKHVVSVSLL